MSLAPRELADSIHWLTINSTLKPHPSTVCGRKRAQSARYSPASSQATRAGFYVQAPRWNGATVGPCSHETESVAFPASSLP